MSFIPRAACFFVLLFVYSAAALSAPPATPAERLNALLFAYQSLSFRFQQQTFDDQGDLVEEAFGHVRLARPNRARWETVRPYPQLIVSDGDSVWLYDPDLLQAIKRPIDTSPAQSFALILLGSPEQLSAAFEVQQPDTAAFTLLPKEDSPYLHSVELIFAAGKLKNFTVIDNAGHTTALALHRLRINPRIAADTFRFTPPAGVDVIDETGGQP